MTKMAAMIHRIVATPPPHSRAAMTKSTGLLPSVADGYRFTHRNAWQAFGETRFSDLSLRFRLAEGVGALFAHEVMDVQSLGWLISCLHHSEPGRERC